MTLPIAREFGFKFTRLIREPGPFGLIPWIFERLSASAIPQLQEAGIGYADHVFGLRATGRMTEAAFRQALRQARGVTEIYFHPGAESDAPSPARLSAMIDNALPLPRD
jgi:hypothetical protein